MTLRLLSRRSPWVVSIAFTLVELLVVISIIAILSGLLLSGLPVVQRLSDRTAATHNLRSLASAILIATADNDGQLPGSDVYSGQSPGYSTSGKDSRLGSMLYNYIGESAPRSTMQYAKVLMPPAYKKAYKNMDGTTVGRTYIMLNRTATNSSGSSVKIWGASASGSTAAIPPARLSSVASVTSLSQLWMFVEVDQQLSKDILGTPSWKSEIAAKPFHNPYRLVGYWDGHVTMSLTNNAPFE